MNLPNVLAKVLRYVKYLNRTDAFADFEKLQGWPPNQAEGLTGRVLIVPFRAEPTSNVFEGVLGTALTARKYSVDYLLCNQSVRSCDHYTIQNVRLIRCSVCLAEQHNFSSIFPGNHVKLGDLLDADTTARLRSMADDVELDQLESVRHHDVPIIDSLRGGMQRFYLQCDPDFKENEKKVRDFLFTILTVIEGMHQICKENAYDFVVTSHGVYSTWGAVADYCKVHGIRLVTWGRGYYGGGIMGAHGSSYLMSEADQSEELWKKVSMNQELRKKVADYINEKSMGSANAADHVSYYSSAEKLEGVRVRGMLRIPPTAKVISMFPNITWDGQVFNSSPMFSSIIKWVHSTLDWFVEHPDSFLVIRAHPAEQKRSEKTREAMKSIVADHLNSLPPNIVFLDPLHKVSSYSLMNATDAALVYGTTLGLETCYRRIPTIMAGSYLYRGKGFTFDPSTLAEYYELLDRASKGQLAVTDTMFEMCEKFIFHFTFERHFPESVQELDGLAHRRLKISSVHQLEPGGVQALDAFVDCCISGKPFVWSADDKS